MTPVDATRLPQPAEAAPFRPRRAALYVALLLTAALIALGAKLRFAHVFGCAASGYSSERYLGYCNATGYGDYDHGAFWFGLEPAAVRHAAAADVLFVGNSRLQFGFSAPATSAFFAARGLRHYLLGFIHTENVQFIEPLLEQIRPEARLYVINVDRFFDDRITWWMEGIKAPAEVLQRDHERQRWQQVHRAICGRVPQWCGDGLAFYRSRNDGAWWASGTRNTDAAAVADRAQEPRTDWPKYIAIAERFIARLPVERRCVVLTIVPSGDTRRNEAEAIAAAVGLPLVVPPVERLSTFDGSHLDPASAERWSMAFLSAAQPRIDACLGHAA